MSALHEAFDQVVADVPVYGDLDRAMEQADRERRRRYRVVAGLAAAAVVVVIVGVLAVTHGGINSEQPVGPPPPTEKRTAIDPVLPNGQITDAQRYLGVDASDYAWRSFDPVSETGLFVIRTSGDELEGLAVVGRTGSVATLTCARDLLCSPDNSLSYVATLGPGEDEITVASGDHMAQVIGYDGTSRRTLDLGATITGDGRVGGLRWSADGSRLAVVTFQDHPSDSVVSRVWLDDREGGDARLAYSLLFDETEPLTRDASDFDGTGAVWNASGWGWSPDGHTLLLDVRTPGSYGADVVLLHLQPDGAAVPATAQTLYHSNRNFDIAGNVAWSPDGTRIAVRTIVPATTTGHHRITEISAEDGRVIAQHPDTPGWVIWPRRER